jgi:hypothetical protein
MFLVNISFFFNFCVCVHGWIDGWIDVFVNINYVLFIYIRVCACMDGWMDDGPLI